MLARAVRNSRPSYPPMSSELNFDISKILRVLPHRSPFLLIDRVTEIEPRTSARAIKCVTYNEPFFPGHFPGQPMFPSVLLIESMSQLMCVLAYASEAMDTTQKMFWFVGIDKARFRHPVTPGDRVELTAKVVQRRSNIWKCDCTASVGEVMCAEATLLAAITDKGESPGA